MKEGQWVHRFYLHRWQLVCLSPVYWQVMSYVTTRNHPAVFEGPGGSSCLGSDCLHSRWNWLEVIWSSECKEESCGWELGVLEPEERLTGVNRLWSYVVFHPVLSSLGLAHSLTRLFKLNQSSVWHLVILDCFDIWFGIIDHSEEWMMCS